VVENYPSDGLTDTGGFGRLLSDKIRQAFDFPALFKRILPRISAARIISFFTRNGIFLVDAAPPPRYSENSNHPIGASFGHTSSGCGMYFNLARRGRRVYFIRRRPFDAPMADRRLQSSGGRRASAAVFPIRRRLRRFIAAVNAARRPRSCGSGFISRPTTSAAAVSNLLEGAALSAPFPLEARRPHRAYRDEGVAAPRPFPTHPTLDTAAFPAQGFAWQARFLPVDKTCVLPDKKESLALSRLLLEGGETFFSHVLR